MQQRTLKFCIHFSFVLFSFERAICSPGVSCQLILIDARTLFWKVLKAFRDKPFIHSSSLMFSEKGLNPKYLQSSATQNRAKLKVL